ncbi:hypothetical protein M407DRAFT_17778 [Tulasnella calospora MUT 4182]|uniref:Uncharacterized protein n=1 Tax=Tulasnella calospora MUT 4182 TaxID=1051891 RepID=A0A0C3QVC6_9AGAM|nr:hypothetical protein M407DRAFT_17778 [Tulasnella calospora MUT 4182]
MDHDHNQHQSFQEEHPAQQPTLLGDTFGQNTVPVVMDPSVQQLAHLFGQIINMQTANLQGHRTNLATFTNDIINRFNSLVVLEVCKRARKRDCYDTFMLQLNPDNTTAEDEEAEPVPNSANPHFSGDQFWTFIDFQLCALQKMITSTAMTKEAREQLLCSTFTSILQVHLQKYIPTDAEAGHGMIGKVTALLELDWDDMITTACA